MRLPMLSRDEADMPQVEEMVDLFLEGEYKYFDSAFTYLNSNSESILGKALVARHPRESFRIATKTPMHSPVPQSVLYERIDIQRARYGIDYFDYYLLHNVSGERVKRFEEAGAWEFLRDIKERGITKHIGFSCHDTAETLDRLLTEHPEVDFVQLQINFIDWLSESVQSKAVYDVATRHGVPVIVMEPIKGGSLMNIPDSAKEVLKAANPDMSLAEWGLRFAQSLDNVAIVLSGMSTIDQVRENVAVMQDDRKLTESEYAAIDEVRRILDSIPTVPCTDCRYCTEVCPMGINIPQFMSAYNGYQIYGKQGGLRSFRGATRNDAPMPSQCVECLSCENTCPQHIEITKYLKEVSAIYENN